MIRSVLVAAAGVVVVLAVLAPAYAWSDDLWRIFPWAAGQPNPPSVDASRSEHLATVRVSDSYDVSFWLVPTSDGDECLALRAIASAGHQLPAEAPSAFANVGLNCGLGGGSQPPEQVQTVLDWLPASGSPWGTSDVAQVLVYGRIPDGIPASGVQLASSFARTPLPMAKKYFFGVLPGDAKIGDLPGNSPYEIVAVDEAGNELARVDLRRLLALSSP